MGTGFQLFINKRLYKPTGNIIDFKCNGRIIFQDETNIGGTSEWIGIILIDCERIIIEISYPNSWFISGFFRASGGSNKAKGADFVPQPVGMEDLRVVVSCSHNLWFDRSIRKVSDSPST